MKKFKFFLSIVSVFLIFAFISCEKQNEVIGPVDEESPNLLNDSDISSESFLSRGVGEEGAVFTMTNSATGNEVLVFDRASDGTLTLQGAYSTGGLGSGSGLGNQRGLILGRNHGLLLVCNAGSNDISSFSVKRNGLVLLDRVPSGGETPISLAAHGRLVYVLNAGGDGNISGFVIKRNGRLQPLANSNRPLSGSGTGPAQIEFSNNGRVLVVTEKATNQILTYRVNAKGQTDGPTIHASSGTTPFGFSISSQGYLIVSEAFGGAANASTASSYKLSNNGGLDVITPALASGQTAACWIVIARNGGFAYATNTGSGNITGYKISPNGALELLNANGITGVTGQGSAPIDMAISRGSRYLYSLNSGTGNISIFRIQHDGSLDHIEETGSLSPATNGLAAF